MKSIITKNGFNIMNQNRADGTVQYWIGYYGLAYIPEEDRDLNEDTTELVEGNKGDIIYNLFQGGMTPVGFDTDNGKNSMAARLMNSCMYTGSVINKFRYVLDENDNNHLVVLADYQPESDSLGLREYTQFDGIGVDDKTESELPIPAPLYYIGEPVPYPSAQTTENMPSVSCDTRVYRASKDALTGEVTQELLSRAAIYDWFDSAENVYTQTYSNSETFKNLALYWQYQSVSNFNRFHAQANVSGYAVDYEPSCRNLSKATRLFPISHYDVIDTKDDVTVSQVKYTISIDMDSVFSKITKRTNVYYNDNGEKLESNPFKVGFKFNRIGVYAVPVTLHAYNTGEDSDGNCENHSVQMQISGNEEPQLFAILDLDTPIVMSEGKVTKYDINFQIDFGEKGNIVDSAAIYYNLYEDDAITWYKNQLIANASTAEAVTSLGVQLNYLRKQLNETVTNGQYLCGIGDDGDNYAVSNTGGGLQNLVDGVQPNGSVRGIDTILESSPVNVYKSNGRFIVKDENDQYVYMDNPSESAPYLVNLPHYSMGDDSLSLGKESVTASNYAVNLTTKGILNTDSDYNVLFGGLSDTSTDDLNDHIAISATKYSIIGAADTTEIENMMGSIWMSSRSRQKRYVDYSMYDSIGMGQVSAFTRDRTAPTGYQEYIGTADEYNLFMGQMNLYAPIAKSIMLVNGRYGYPNDIGHIKLTHSMDIDALMNGAESEYDIFPLALYKTINTSILVGNAISVDRDLYSVLFMGGNSAITAGTKNSFIIGNNVNMDPANRIPDKILTVDEFNEKYSGKLVADDDYMFREGSEPYSPAIIIGDGQISALNSDGSDYTREVKGVCLYIRYLVEDSTDPDSRFIWSTKTSSVDYTEYPDSYRAYTPSGQNMKNMFMLGDNNSVGFNSCNSIIIGDDSTNRRIIYKNSFINIAGSEKPSNLSNGARDFNKPMGIFNNVWWIGHNYSDSTAFVDPELGSFPTCGDQCYYTDGGNFICNTWQYTTATSSSLREFSDVFAFVGRNNRQFAFASWYGMYYASSGWEDYTERDLNQSCKTPMIYTGGIALGGYGTSDSNFMLLKIGMRGCWTGDTYGVTDGTACMWTPSLDQIRNIVYLQNGKSTAKPAKVVNVDGKYDLYDDLCSDGIHHLQVKSPFAGKFLMVQDKQELDGTLHVGLGSPSDAIYGTKRFISLKSQYVGDTNYHTIIVNEGDRSYTMKTFSTKFEDYGPNPEYGKDYTTDVVSFGEGFKFSAIINFESLSGGGYNLYVKKMYLEVPLDERYMVHLTHYNSQSSLKFNATSDYYVVGVGGKRKLPTYIWSDTSNIFQMLWHPVLKLSGTSISTGESYETLTPDSNVHVYKLMPISWLYGQSEYSTKTFTDANPFTGDIYYTASQSSLSSSFEEVTGTEGLYYSPT